jgi:uncharacterized protein YndB with AHSA1/START domain
MRRNRTDVSERGWVAIENAVEIARAPEDVFDYLTDITREFEWNPRTRRAKKLTPGEIGVGTRFDAEWIKGNPMIVEYVTFERPTAWTSIARSRRLDVRAGGRITGNSSASRPLGRSSVPITTRQPSAVAEIRERSAEIHSGRRKGRCRIRRGRNDD